ncbi:unnamed protein product, partial [Didymodactylos carnosus]
NLDRGMHFYQLKCDDIPLQPYQFYVENRITDLDIEISQSPVKSGQIVEYTVSLAPTFDVMFIFNCGQEIKVNNTLQIFYVNKIDEKYRLIIQCKYDTPGQYSPMISASNKVSVFNQTTKIDVEEPIPPYHVEVENRKDITQVTLVTIRAKERIPFHGIISLTIFSSISNITKNETIQLSLSNNFTDYFYLNITTYGYQTLLVKGGEFPTIREASTKFSIGTDLTSVQTYLINNYISINDNDNNLIWIDIQYFDGIGFNTEINMGNGKIITLYYGILINSPMNKIKQFDDNTSLKRLSKTRFQIGYQYQKAGTYNIDITFINPSSKKLKSLLTCSQVTIIDKPLETSSCINDQLIYLYSDNAVNTTITAKTPVLLLPFNKKHILIPKLPSICNSETFSYSFYLINTDPLNWKYSQRLNRLSSTNRSIYTDEYLSYYCSNIGKTKSLIIEPKSLQYGYYFIQITIVSTINPSIYREIIQPIEIVKSDLNTSFGSLIANNLNGTGGTETISDDEDITINFWSKTNDPDDETNDKRKLNFTLICYLPSEAQNLFPDDILLGNTRPSENNIHNLLNIRWSNLSLVIRPELNIQLFEHRCFLNKIDYQHIIYESTLKTLNISEKYLQL